MDEQSGADNGAETISDIHNYLASFNKEIQDGGQGSGREGVGRSADESGGGGAAGDEEAGTTTTTYYVTQAAPGAEGFQYTAATGQAQFEGGAFYTSADGNTFFAPAATAGDQASQVQYATAFHAATGEQAAQAFQTPDGLQQIVLAVNEANPIATAEAGTGDGQEIAVTIPDSIGSSEQMVKVEQGDGEGLATLISGEGGQTIRMVLRQPDGTESEQAISVASGSAGPTLLTSDGQELHVGEEGTLQMMANLAGHATAANPVLLNAAGGNYQTVTIVPSDTNPGEVSYVLIVSQSDDVKDEKDVDMSVYDFNEQEKHGVVREDVTSDGTKMRTIKITQKKNATINQAHMCNYCNYTSPKRYLLTRHLKSHSEERPHKCSVCERGFKTLASLQNHMNTHTGTRPHQCKDCASCFTTSGELVRHVRYRHTHEKPHRCTECDYASVELSKLKRHMRCHTGERPYQCPHCTYASPDTYKLKRHLRIHTGEKPYECDICHSRFTQSNSLKAHKLIHSGNKPIFQCEYCPTTCGRKTDLRIHVQKLHTSDRPLKCKRCGKSFPDRYSYKLHVKSHEGEKCYKCDLCHYASISHRHLESHMLIHTDQKPFRCDECNQSFRQKQLLKRHKNLYHDPNFVPPVPREKTHECPECSKAFRHKGNLIRHMSLHDPDATADERADAMKIGLPKQPGEQPDGEEDDEEDEDDYNGIDDYMDEESAMTIAEQQNHVVVFELVDYGDHPQLGEVVAAANGNPGEGVAILQQLEGTNLEEVAAAVAQVHGDDPNRIIVPIGPPITATKSTPQTVQKKRGRPRKYPAVVPNASSGVDPGSPSSQGTPSIMTPSLQVPRKRGRPRKYPYSDVARPYVVPVTKVDMEDEGEEEDNHPHHQQHHQGESRFLRKRRSIDYEAMAAGMPPKKGRVRELHSSSSEGEDDVECEEDSLEEEEEDDDSMDHREEELKRKQMEEKEKDMAECFGFNEDEEEAETILAMPAAPGTKPLVYNDVAHQNGGGE